MNSQFINYQRIEQSINFLGENFKAQPSLDEVAQRVHLSPFHFQRLFTDWVGLSPKKFLQYLTVEHLRAKIAETQTVLEAADLVGLSSQSRVYDLFVSVEGVTPQQFKSAGQGLEIVYGYHATPFGQCFIAVTERGVCGLRFVDEARQREEFTAFARQWHFATLTHNPAITQPYVRRLFAPAGSRPPERLQVLVQGSPFQIKVWEALVHIPFGTVSSFQQLATAIGQPTAARAVGAAVAHNTILYLIPCHRVICQTGAVGDYHVGQARKKALIGWEMAHCAAAQESGCAR